MRTAALISLAVLVAGTWRPARADTYHVDVDGDDAADGTREAPWRTLQRAADQVRPGDVVEVGPGRFRGFELTRSGTEDARIVFRARRSGADGARGTGARGAARDGGHPVEISPRQERPDAINLEGASFVDIVGFEVSGARRAGIRAVECRAVTIRGNAVHDNRRWGIFTGFCDDLRIEDNTSWGAADEHGIYVSNSGDRPVIRRNRIFGNAMNGIHLNGDVREGGDGVISAAVIEGNTIYDNGRRGGAAINADGVTDSEFRDNLIHGNYGNGVALYRENGGAPSVRNRIIHNTIAMPAGGRWCVRIANAGADNRFEGNVCTNEHGWRGAIDISVDSLPGFISDGNALIGRFTVDDGRSVLTLGEWRDRTKQDVRSIEAGALELFVAPERGDYRARADSPAAALGAGSRAAPACGARCGEAVAGAPEVYNDRTVMVSAEPGADPRPAGLARPARPAKTGGGCCRGQASGSPLGHAACVIALAWLWRGTRCESCS